MYWPLATVARALQQVHVDVCWHIYKLLEVLWKLSQGVLKFLLVSFPTIVMCSGWYVLSDP